MIIAMTGLALIVLAMIVAFHLDDADPYHRLFPWAWKLVRLMFSSGVVIAIIGLIYQVWRFLE